MKTVTYLCLALFCCATLHAQTENKSTIQRVRIDFTTPQGFVRHLLLGFTSDNRASDGIDYGYDARNIEKLPDDLNWMIASERFVIQGVGAFDASKMYPFGMFLTNSGSVDISLKDLENFPDPINIFIYDSWEKKYHRINEKSYKNTMASGVYENRFFISFDNEAKTVLSNEETTLNDVSITYFQNSKTLRVNTQGLPFDLKLYNLQGQLLNVHHLNSTTTTHHLPLAYLSNQVLLTVLESGNKTLYKRVLIN